MRAVVSLDRYRSSRGGGSGGNFTAAVGEVRVVVVKVDAIVDSSSFNMNRFELRVRSGRNRWSLPIRVKGVGAVW